MLRSGGEKPRVARSVTDSKEAGPSLVHPEVGAALPSRLKDLSGVELSDFAVSKARTENPTQASFLRATGCQELQNPVLTPPNRDDTVLLEKPHFQGGQSVEGESADQVA